MPGSMSVTRQPVPFELLAQRLAHRRDGVLRRRVEAAGQRAAAGDRAREHEVPLAVADRRERRADRVGDAEHVRQDHVAPVLGRVLEEAALGAEAGVGEDDVDAAEARRARLREALVVLPLGDVGGHGDARRRRRRARRRAPRACPPSARRARRGSPASTAMRAVAAPMPVDAPVMRKTLRSSSAMGSFLEWDTDMLYDKARIFVQGGAGGNGVSSFRREAHVPHGGPDGGDGGRGGDVVLLCDDSLRDLQSFKRRPHYKAKRGRHGEGALRHGADGEDLVVRVPPGTRGRGLGRDVVRPRRARARASSSPPAGRAGAATSASRRRRARRRASPSAASPGTRAGSTCGSSCSPTSASSGCRTPASRRCSRG